MKKLFLRHFEAAIMLRKDCCHGAFIFPVILEPAHNTQLVNAFYGQEVGADESRFDTNANEKQRDSTRMGPKKFKLGTKAINQNGGARNAQFLPLASDEFPVLKRKNTV